MSSAVVLRDLARAFAALGVRWYVFGAQAAIIYGSTRVTEDVDVTVELGPRSPSELVDALEKHGVTSRSSDAAFVAKTRVLPLVHRRTGMPVDVVLAGPGLEELFMDRIEHHTRARRTIPVARAEDIVVMKLLAGRPRDREDILAILRAGPGRLDLALIHETIAMLEEALCQSDLRPAFDDLAKQARLPKPRGE